MCKKTMGRKHRDTLTAYQHFKNQCKTARAHLQFTLPEILKHQPKVFWNMLKQKDAEETQVQMKKFV